MTQRRKGEPAGRYSGHMAQPILGKVERVSLLATPLAFGLPAAAYGTGCYPGAIVGPPVAIPQMRPFRLCRTGVISQRTPSHQEHEGPDESDAWHPETAHGQATALL